MLTPCSDTLGSWWDLTQCNCSSINRGQNPRGVLKYVSYTGMCRPNGLFFHKKSLDKGPLFRGKTLKHGSSFPKCSKFWVFAIQNFKKFRVFAWRTLKNFKKAYILRKILRNGYLFLAKWPLEKGKGFQARAAHPRSNQILPQGAK